MESRSKDHITKTQLGFRKGVGTRDSIGFNSECISPVMKKNQSVYKSPHWDLVPSSFTSSHKLYLKHDVTVFQVISPKLDPSQSLPEPQGALSVLSDSVAVHPSNKSVFKVT